MSDQPPLFRDSDATERDLAPEQVPGTVAEQTRQQDDVVTYVPVRGDLSQNQPIALPAQTAVNPVKGGDDSGNLIE